LYRSRSGEKTTKEIADGLGIHQENLCRWLRESKEGGKNNLIIFPGQGNPRDEELARLKKENADLRETSD
jgi:transposase-like protein